MTVKQKSFFEIVTARPQYGIVLLFTFIVLHFTSVSRVKRRVKKITSHHTDTQPSISISIHASPLPFYVIMIIICLHSPHLNLNICAILCQFTHILTLWASLLFQQKYHSRTQGFVICCIIPHFVVIVLVVFVTFMGINVALWILYSPQSKNNVLQIPLYFLYTHAYIPFGFIGLSNILPLAVSPRCRFAIQFTELVKCNLISLSLWQIM